MVTLPPLVAPGDGDVERQRLGAGGDAATPYRREVARLSRGGDGAARGSIRIAGVEQAAGHQGEEVEAGQLRVLRPHVRAVAGRGLVLPDDPDLAAAACRGHGEGLVSGGRGIELDLAAVRRLDAVERLGQHGGAAAVLAE